MKYIGESRNINHSICTGRSLLSFVLSIARCDRHAGTTVMRQCAYVHSCEHHFKYRKAFQLTSRINEKQSLNFFERVIHISEGKPLSTVSGSKSDTLIISMFSHQT